MANIEFCTLNPFKAAKKWRPSVCQFANHALVKINHVVATFGIKATLPKDAMKESEVMSHSATDMKLIVVPRILRFRHA